MGRLIKFPVPEHAPEKFGLQRVRSKRTDAVPPPKAGQLNLFSGARLVRMHTLTHFEEALLLDDRGDDIKAAKLHYQKAIEAGEYVADAYCNLGILECQEGHTARAINCFTQGLKFEPRHFEAHYNLANLYAEVGNLPLAKVHYEISIELEPTFPNSHFNLGLALAMNKEFKEAIKMLQRYKALTPNEEHQYTDDLLEKLQSAS
jgi:tetratricopeptide (TPR) repeat protein